MVRKRSYGVGRMCFLSIDSENFKNYSEKKGECIRCCGFLTIMNVNFLFFLILFFPDLYYFITLRVYIFSNTICALSKTWKLFPRLHSQFSIFIYSLSRIRGNIASKRKSFTAHKCTTRNYAFANHIAYFGILLRIRHTINGASVDVFYGLYVYYSVRVKRRKQKAILHN